MSISLADIIFSSRTDRLRGAQAQTVALMRGSYLPTENVDPGLERWQTRAAIMQARHAALTAPNPARAHQRQYAVTAESALKVHGIDTWTGSHTIHLRSAPPLKKSRMLQLPAVTMHRVYCPAVEAKVLRSKRVGSDVHMVRGIRTLSVEEAILDLIRSSHPLVAWVGTSFGIRQLASFDRFRMFASRERERQVKGRLLQMAEPLRGKAGFRKIEQLIEAVDAGVESVGEALFSYLLHVLLRGDRRPEARFVCQYEAHAGRRRFFLDVALPALKLDCEFDGSEKMLHNRRAAREWLERRHALRDAGWKELSFSSSALTNPWQMARDIAKRLESEGLRPQPLGGPLWKPLPQDLVDPARLF